jgi:biotin carboxyl carrier protein
VECEVLDLRSLAPLDTQAILGSLERTGRLLVVDEAYGDCGIGAEIAARIMEEGFDLLDAPVLRLHTAAVSHPFSPVFDPVVIPQVEGIIAKVRLLMEGGPATGPPRERPAAVESRFPESGPRAPAALPVAPAAAANGAARQASREGLRGGRVEVVIPNQGLTVSEAKVTLWRFAVGARVAKGQPLFEIETDKATLEVEADQEGILDEIVAPAGTTLPLGGVVAYLRPLASGGGVPG